ncbi:penicillin-binding transpeptidase domain-containing protein, partial [Pseudomonas aeruginosa]
VLQVLGIERAISYSTKFGFQRDELPRNFSLALGTAPVTPMETAGAWSVFANGGYKVNPYVIERSESRDGQVLKQATPPRVPEA